jgi:hypothetical protein
MMGSVSWAFRQGARKNGKRSEARLNWRAFVRMKGRSDPFRMNFLASERAQEPSATFKKVD